jgi:hypothetical protein
MEIAKIMQRLNESRATEQGGIKTASATPAPTSPDALRAALRDTLSAAPQTMKTAAVAPTANPTGDLLKLAEDLTSAEEEALLKQASLYGAAMCDGFMARYAQYEEAANQVAPVVKTAAAQATVPVQTPMQFPADAGLETIKMAAANDPAFQKFAAENPDLVKEAVDLGYRQTWDALVKQANDDFQRGYEDTLQETHKMAAECYKTGAIMINNVLRTMQSAA